MAGGTQPRRGCAFGLADEMLRMIRSAGDRNRLWSVARDFSDEIRSRHFAIITHEDLRIAGPGMVDLCDYAEGAERRIIGESRYRRDPVTFGTTRLIGGVRTAVDHLTR